MPHPRQEKVKNLCSTWETASDNPLLPTASWTQTRPGGFSLSPLRMLKQQDLITWSALRDATVLYGYSQLHSYQGVPLEEAKSARAYSRAARSRTSQA